MALSYHVGNLSSEGAKKTKAKMAKKMAFKGHKSCHNCKKALKGQKVCPNCYENND